MPNYGYHLARSEGDFVRRMYCALLPRIVRKPIEPRGEIPLEVFAYSGHAGLPEQVASIRSFLRYAGRPGKFTVVSDGTYTSEDMELLQRVDDSVSVIEFSKSGAFQNPVSESETLAHYLSSHPTGRQLALIMSLPRNGPALYVDSDVLFFSQAREFAALANAGGVPAFYLADCQFSGDARLIRLPNEQDQPVNTGVLLLFRKLDWSLAIERFSDLNGAPNFFTNQTMTHLAMHANGASPFDQTKYILQLDDQTLYADRYASDSIALRHYVNPVRHKFWTTLWRQ